MLAGFGWEGCQFGVFLKPQWATVPNECCSSRGQKLNSKQGCLSASMPHCHEKKDGMAIHVGHSTFRNAGAVHCCGTYALGLHVFAYDPDAFHTKAKRVKSTDTCGPRHQPKHAFFPHKKVERVCTETGPQSRTTRRNL